MFAVVRTGGKQYRVAPGDKIVVEKLDGNAGDTVTLGDVLLAGEGSDLKKTDGLKVSAEIVAQAKGEKVTVFKKRRRHNYRRKKGHRQQHTILRIVAIGDHKAEKPAKAAAEKPAKAAAAKADSAPAKASKPGSAANRSDEEGVAVVNARPTENPAPSKESEANHKKGAPDKPTAKTPSTKNAAPAKGAAKKSAPKAKKK
jgi:large subunit ribosomal protein L21